MARTVKFGIVFLLVVVGVIPVFLYWSFTRLAVSPEPFSSAHWKELASVGETSNDPGCYRGAMALDIVEKRMLINKTIGDLDALLGAAEIQNTGQWSYFVGQCSGDWVANRLVVNFGRNGVITHAEIVRES